MPTPRLISRDGAETIWSDFCDSLVFCLASGFLPRLLTAVAFSKATACLRLLSRLLSLFRSVSGVDDGNPKKLRHGVQLLGREGACQKVRQLVQVLLELGAGVDCPVNLSGGDESVETLPVVVGISIDCVMLPSPTFPNAKGNEGLESILLRNRFSPF